MPSTFDDLLEANRAYAAENPILGFDGVAHAGVAHLAIQLFGFARALADAAEQADALVAAHHVVDQFSNDDGLAHSSPTERRMVF